jgi:hypothetical protein
VGWLGRWTVAISIPHRLQNFAEGSFIFPQRGHSIRVRLLKSRPIPDGETLAIA